MASVLDIWGQFCLFCDVLFRKHICVSKESEVTIHYVWFRIGHHHHLFLLEHIVLHTCSPLCFFVMLQSLLLLDVSLYRVPVAYLPTCIFDLLTYWNTWLSYSNVVSEQGLCLARRRHRRWPAAATSSSSRMEVLGIAGSVGERIRAAVVGPTRKENGGVGGGAAAAVGAAAAWTGAE